LHQVAVRYGLSTNLWTAIILMIPVLLHKAGQVGGFLVYDCSHDQLKTETIDLTAPKDCKDPTTDYYPARTTKKNIQTTTIYIFCVVWVLTVPKYIDIRLKIRIILNEGDMPVMAKQCIVLKTQEVTRCGGH
jgi:hypothetical protein